MAAGIAEFILRHDPGTDWAGRVEPLALEPLPMAGLQVARGDIVDDRIAEYCIIDVRARDIARGATDDDPKFDLVVELLCQLWIQPNVVLMANHCRRWL